MLLSAGWPIRGSTKPWTTASVLRVASLTAARERFSDTVEDTAKARPATSIALTARIPKRMLGRHAATLFSDLPRMRGRRYVLVVRPDNRTIVPASVVPLPRATIWQLVVGG